MLAANPSPMTLEGTRSYLIGEDRPVVIDPGPDRPEHLHDLFEALQGRTPAAIVLTHAHADHAGAALELARRSDAPIWMGHGSLRPLPAGVPVHLARDREQLETDAGALEIVTTPGHTPEHLALHWTDPHGKTALFVGDLLLGEGNTTLVAAPEGDVAHYLASLRKIEALGADRLYPAHGPPIVAVRARIEEYRQHRLRRIEQVRAALEALPGASIDALVARIYRPHLDPSLRAAAGAAVEAMVQYVQRVNPFV